MNRIAHIAIRISKTRQFKWTLYKLVEGMKLVARIAIRISKTGLYRWVHYKLEESRMRPERVQQSDSYLDGRGLRGKAANHAWASIAVSSLMSESMSEDVGSPLLFEGHSMLLLDEIDKRSPKR